MLSFRPKIHNCILFCPFRGSCGPIKARTISTTEMELFDKEDCCTAFSFKKQYLINFWPDKWSFWHLEYSNQVKKGWQLFYYILWWWKSSNLAPCTYKKDPFKKNVSLKNSILVPQRVLWVKKGLYKKVSIIVGEIVVRNNHQSDHCDKEKVLNFWPQKTIFMAFKGSCGPQKG